MDVKRKAFLRKKTALDLRVIAERLPNEVSSVEMPGLGIDGIYVVAPGAINNATNACPQTSPAAHSAGLESAVERVPFEGCRFSCEHSRRMTTISAWAVGSCLRSPSLNPLAATSPSFTRIAPTSAPPGVCSPSCACQNAKRRKRMSSFETIIVRCGQSSWSVNSWLIRSSTDKLKRRGSITYRDAILAHLPSTRDES